ncbi:MAG: GTPase [bacterium]
MKECLVFGRTNVGKTMFVLNFAEYLGLNKIEVRVRFPNEFVTKKEYSIAQAKRELTGLGPHKTRSLQSVTVEIPAGKGKKKLEITDTTGLIDTIHEDVEIRRAIAQTLGMLRQADILIHIIDVSKLMPDPNQPLLDAIDYQLIQYAQLKGRYCILANKMDLPGAKEGLQRLQQELPGQYIIPISALYKRGFKEVKTFVTHSI